MLPTNILKNHDFKIKYYLKNKPSIHSDTIFELLKEIKPTINKKELIYFLNYGHTSLNGTLFNEINKSSFLFDANLDNNLEIIDDVSCQNKIKSLLYNFISNCKSQSCNILISGGLDSAILSKIAKDNFEIVNTYSLIFPNDNRIEDVNCIVEHLNTCHKNIFVDIKVLPKAVESYIVKLNEPYADNSFGAIQLFCDEIREGGNKNPLLFTGKGADEVFGVFKPNNLIPELIALNNLYNANSLRLEVPYLDNHFMEFVLNLPSTYKRRYGKDKYILRQAFSKDLPRKIINKPNQGSNVLIDRNLGRHYNGELNNCKFLTKYCPRICRMVLSKNNKLLIFRLKVLSVWMNYYNHILEW